MAPTENHMSEFFQWGAFVTVTVIFLVFAFCNLWMAGRK